MPNIRDEFSKVVDVRIPPNGYRKYIKEISRTGGFQNLQHENTLIILLEAVDEMQRHIEELVAQKLDDPVAGELPMSPPEKFICPDCGKELKNMFGLMGHMKSHEKRSVPTTPTK